MYTCLSLFWKITSNNLIAIKLSHLYFLSLQIDPNSRCLAYLDIGYMFTQPLSAVGLQSSKVQERLYKILSSPVKSTVEFIYFQDKCQWRDNSDTSEMHGGSLYDFLICWKNFFKVAKVEELEIAEKGSHQKLLYSSFAFISTWICEFSYRLCKYSHFDCWGLSALVCIHTLHVNRNLRSWCTWNSWVQYVLGLKLEMIMESKKLYI